MIVLARREGGGGAAQIVWWEMRWRRKKEEDVSESDSAIAAAVGKYGRGNCSSSRRRSGGVRRMPELNGESVAALVMSALFLFSNFYSLKIFMRMLKSTWMIVHIYMVLLLVKIITFGI